MSALSIQPTYQIFTDIDGQPLEDGYIWIGVVNLAPIVNPITVYWDAALTIPAAQPIRTRGGYPVNSGTPARLYVNSDYSIQVQNKNGSVVYSAPAATERYSDVVLPPKDYVSVFDFMTTAQIAAVQAGTSVDDTAAIQAANNAAAVNKKTLFIPAGLYKVTPLTATTSWLGEAGGTIIKYLGTGTVDLVVCNSVPNVVFENIIFDGNVSPDPLNWNTGYNTFTGARGLIVAYSDNARIVNCHAQNNWHHGFKVDQSDGVVISGCTTNKNRGNFGDGFYNNSCTNLKISNCLAYDFTRIGFVCDTDGANLTSYNILVENCQAEYGHDASINYGGAEYNAGLWFENTAHVEVNNYTAVNMQGGQGRGLLLCTGLQNNGVIGNTAKFSASNIQVQDCAIGIIMYSLGTFPISAIVDNANLTNVINGVFFGLTLEDSSAICTNSHVDLEFILGNGQSRAYAWGQENPALTRRPSVTFANCTVAHINEIAGYLAGYGTTTACADVGSATIDTNRVGVELNVHNVRNVDTDKPIWIGIPLGQDCNVNVTDCFVSAAQNEFLITGELMFSDCKFQDARFGNGSASKCTVKNSLIVGQCAFGGDLMQFENNQVVIDDTSYVWLFGHNYSTNNPAITVSGCYFSKDINANDKVLRFQFGTVDDKFVVTDCTFFNSGAPSATNAFIQHATGEVYLFNGVFKDSTVTNMLVRDTGIVPVPLPAGVTAETFH